MKIHFHGCFFYMPFSTLYSVALTDFYKFEET